VSAALVFGNAGLGEFMPRNVQSEQIRQLMKLVTVKVAPRLEAEFEQHPEKW